MQWKRLVYYLLINVAVSAATTLVVLTLWDRAHRDDVEQVTPVAELPAIPTKEVEINTPTPLPTPTLAAREHRVQSGDTLGSISLEYDVTVEEILELNDLPDPNSLEVDQVIYIPLAEPPSNEDATPAPTSAGGAGAGQVEIVSVVGVGDLDTERIVLGDAQGEKHALAGWQLKDEDGNLYAFPQATLYENGQINVNTRSGVDNPLDLFWNLTDAVWSPGEIVTLLDADGNVQATYQVP
jgi:LysM repeat protein